MSARTRRSTAAAITLTAAITAGAALLTGCGPDVPTATGKPTSAPTSAVPATTGPSAGATDSPSASATPSAPATPSTAPGSTPTSAPATPSAPAVNGTAHSALTISNGTNYVLMNGTSVDFGTKVRDLAWSPDGSKAVFVDGAGNLVVSNPDGSGRVTVAKNPGGQTWSHPTWQVTAKDPGTGMPARNNLFFAAAQGGVSRLETIPATAVNGTPEQLSLDAEGDDTTKAPPQTGNSWPNAGGKHGSAVYANSADGKVYIRDDYIREMVFAVTAGSEPALSPDESELVFVRSSQGHDHVFEQSTHGGTLKDLTPNATTDYTEPAWSPDGSTVALRTPTGIATVPANGSKAPTVISGYPGLPAYRG